MDALGAKRQSMHAHTGVTHAHGKSPRAQGTKPTQKPTDSTLSILTDTRALSMSVWKSRRRIQVNPIQDYQILTTAHTLCWALKIPN